MKTLNRFTKIVLMALMVFSGINTADLLLRGETGASAVFLLVGVLGWIANGILYREIRKDGGE